MKNNQRVNERIVSASEILWQIIERWKLIVCFSLMIMILFCGVMRWRDSNRAAMINSQSEMNQKKTSAELIHELPDEEQSAVTSAYQMNQQLLGIEKHISESPLMRCDPYQARRFRTDWVITGEKAQEAKLQKAYALYLNSDDFCENLLPLYENKVDVDQLRDFITCDALDEESQGAFSCELLVYEDLDEAALCKVFMDAVEAAHTKITDDVGEHQINCVNQEMVQGVDRKLSEHQKTIYEKMSLINSQLKIVTDAFSRNQKDVYDKITSIEKETDDDIQTPQKKMLLRNVLIGLILGLLISIACLVLRIFFLGKVSSRDDLEGFNLYTLGQWYEDQPHGGIASIVTDRSIYRRHHQDHLDKDSEIKQTVQAISNACSQLRNQLVFTVTSPLSNEKESFCDEVRAILGANNISARVVYVDENHHVFDEASTSETDGVVVIAVNGKTRFRQVDRIIEQCTYYKVPIYGHIYLG